MSRTLVGKLLGHRTTRRYRYAHPRLPGTGRQVDDDRLAEGVGKAIAAAMVEQGGPAPQAPRQSWKTRRKGKSLMGASAGSSSKRNGRM